MPVHRINEFPDGSGSLTNDDLFLFMDDPSGSGITKKISLNQISSAIGGGGVDLGNYFNTTLSAGSGLIFSFSSEPNTLTINSSGIVSNTLAVSGSDPIRNIIGLTQAEYDSLGGADPNTLYVIV